MIVYSDHQLEQFQVLGNTLRVHWDYQQYQVVDEINSENTRTAWMAQEAVFDVGVDRPTFESEINSLGGPGETLADQWFNLK